MVEKKIKRGDFIVIMSAGLLAGALFAGNWLNNKFKNHASNDMSPLVARLERHGEIMAEIDLNQLTEAKQIYFDDRVKITIEAEPGRIRFLDSECPDQICVHTGWLTQQGQIAVCMPGRTVLSL